MRKATKAASGRALVSAWIGAQLRALCWTLGHPIVWAGALRAGDRVLLPTMRVVTVTDVYDPHDDGTFLVGGYYVDTGGRWIVLYHSESRVRLAPTKKGHHQ